MGEQQGRNVDEELLNVDDEEKLRRNFKSVYYMMNAKPDSKTKIFTSDVCIELGDIEELNELITEKFKSHYNDAGFMINVDVSLENKKSINLSRVPRPYFNMGVGECVLTDTLSFPLIPNILFYCVQTVFTNR